MSSIRSKDTRPEKKVRSLLHASGLRFRLHRKDLPGQPDIIFPKYNSALFVNGCFWHYHQKCNHGKIPKSRQSYWKPKLLNTVRRDKRNIKNLKRLGWKVMVIWECEINKNPRKATGKVIKFLDKHALEKFIPVKTK